MPEHKEMDLLEETLFVEKSVEDEHDSDDIDLLPEYCRYRDEGCELAASCLNCPFSQCVYDQPGGRQGMVKKIRDRLMLNLFSGEGETVKELARLFGVSERTVQRALKGAAQDDSAHKKISVKGELSRYE